MGLDWRFQWDTMGTRRLWERDCKAFVVAVCLKHELPLIGLQGAKGQAGTAQTKRQKEAANPEMENTGSSDSTKLPYRTSSEVQLADEDLVVSGAGSTIRFVVDSQPLGDILRGDTSLDPNAGCNCRPFFCQGNKVRGNHA